MFHKLLMVTLAFAPVSLLSSASHVSVSRTTNVISVQAQAKELAQGYLSWLHKHPELRPGSGSKLAQEGKSGDPYNIAWPTLDIYSRTGVSIFHGNDSDVNVKIIQRLPRVVPPPDNSQAAKRPTLLDAIAMFPEVPQNSSFPPAHVQYTVFVITYTDRPACAAQDQAVQALKKRVDGSQIRIIEVRL